MVYTINPEYYVKYIQLVYYQLVVFVLTIKSVNHVNPILIKWAERLRGAWSPLHASLRGTKQSLSYTEWLCISGIATSFLLAMTFFSVVQNSLFAAKPERGSASVALPG
ncbi:hypothetical protein SAMN05428975_0572 [Mucilaginibacter sp. OK268]|nr:hypothetical protein SAMN05428975_0572 [Mucilaginibacter sp. OK268]